MLRGDACAAPPGVLNALYTEVLVPLFPAKLTAWVATTFWAPLSEMPWPVTLLGSSRSAQKRE